MKLKEKLKKITIWFIGLWLSSLLNPLLPSLNKNLAEKIDLFVPRLGIDFLRVTSYQIPVYQIILLLGIVWLLFKLYNFLILRTRKLRILKAEYGSGTTFIDITTQLNNFVVNDKISIPLKNSVAGSDPTPGATKIGKIEYELNGKKFNKTYIEGQTIELP